jgi:A/G-specific adenine glycosylase
MLMRNEEVVPFQNIDVGVVQKPPARIMPWRENKTPYRVWVSEVMLQQTRVDTVIPYFERFVSRFPTLESLAQAPEEDLLKAWEGLGYYQRARNLRQAARILVGQGSVCPSTATGWKELPGIGPYAAGAHCLDCVSATAFPAVDGNVYPCLVTHRGTAR